MARILVRHRICWSCIGWVQLVVWGGGHMGDFMKVVYIDDANWFKQLIGIDKALDTSARWDTIIVGVARADDGGIGKGDRDIGNASAKIGWGNEMTEEAYGEVWMGKSNN